LEPSSGVIAEARANYQRVLAAARKDERAKPPAAWRAFFAK